jgi:hypothetical protein
MFLHRVLQWTLLQRVPVREYVRDVVRTLSTQYAALAGPVRSGSTLLLLLLLAAAAPLSSCKRCWPVTGLQDVDIRLWQVYKHI